MLPRKDGITANLVLNGFPNSPALVWSSFGVRHAVLAASLLRAYLVFGFLVL